MTGGDSDTVSIASTATRASLSPGPSRRTRNISVRSQDSEASANSVIPEEDEEAAEAAEAGGAPSAAAAASVAARRKTVYGAEPVLGKGADATNVHKLIEELDRTIRDKETARCAMQEKGKDVRPLDQAIRKLQQKKRGYEHYMERTKEWFDHLGDWDASIISVDNAMDDGDSSGPLYVIAVSRSGRQEDCGGWIVARYLSEFHTMHEQLQECSDGLLPKKLPVPPRPWFQSLRSISEEAYQEKSRAALNQYLELLLRNDLLCNHELLYSFLCNPSMEGVDGHLDDEDDEDDGDEEETRGKDSIAKPLYVLISEVFELKGLFTWLRRQLIFFVQLTYGSSINRGLRETVEWLFCEAQLLYYIQIFRDTMFPDDWTPPPPKTPAELERTREEARQLLLRGMPDILQTLVGVAAARRGALKMFHSVQSFHMNKHLCYVLLEHFLVALMPEELQARDLADVLVQLDARGERRHNGGEADDGTGHDSSGGGSSSSSDSESEDDLHTEHN